MNASANLARFVEVAVGAHAAPGEDVTWDIGPTIIPTPNGPVAVVLLVMWMPGGVLGQRNANVVTIGDPWAHTPETIDRLIAGVIEALREARSAQLAQVT